MLRDYFQSNNRQLLDTALAQFIDLSSRLHPIEAIVLSPDSFLWRITDGNRMYYLYAEDYITSMVAVKKTVSRYAPRNAVLAFVHVKKPLAFEDAIPNRCSTFYRPPENEYEVARYSGQSGYDFVFLLESSESVDTVSHQAMVVKAGYDVAPYRQHIGRDIMVLAETAAMNDDLSGVLAVQHITDTLDVLGRGDEQLDTSALRAYLAILEAEMRGDREKDGAEKKRLADTLYQQLAYETDKKQRATSYEAAHLPKTVTLVTAMYAKREAEVTNGTSIAVIADGDTLAFPMHHFLDDELRAYLHENNVYENDLEYCLPTRLGDYTLVEGSINKEQIFRREIGYINW